MVTRSANKWVNGYVRQIDGNNLTFSQKHLGVHPIHMKVIAFRLRQQNAYLWIESKQSTIKKSIYPLPVLPENKNGKWKVFSYTVSISQLFLQKSLQSKWIFLENNFQLINIQFGSSKWNEWNILVTLNTYWHSQNQS